MVGQLIAGHQQSVWWMKLLRWLDQQSKSVWHIFVKSTIFMCTFQRSRLNSIPHRLTDWKIKWTNPKWWNSISHVLRSQVNNLKLFCQFILCMIKIRTRNILELHDFQIYSIWCWLNAKTFSIVAKLLMTLKLILLCTFLIMVTRHRCHVRTSINGIQCGIWSQVW